MRDYRGELAQLVRAPALHAGGQGFDSLILHEEGVGVSVGVGVKNISPIQSTGKPQKFFDILKENTTELVIRLTLYPLLEN